MRPSLRRQLLIWLLLPQLVLWAVGGLLAYRIALTYAEKAIDQSLTQSVRALARQVKPVGSGLLVDFPRAAQDVLEADPDDRVSYMVSSPPGQFLLGNQRLPQPAQPPSAAGDPLLYSPETSASLALLYDRPLNATLGMRGSLSGRWQSDSTAGDPNDPLYDIDAYGILNGTIGVYSLNDKWDLSIWGQNLTDEYYWQQITSNANVVVRFAGKPRTYGATLSYRF